MTTTQSPATCFVRPVRPDVLERAGFKLRSLQASAGVVRADAAQVTRGLVATARLSREYLDGIRLLLRARGPVAAVKALERLRKTTVAMHEKVAAMGPALARAREAAGDGEDAAGLVEVWFQGGGPKELTAEGRLRQALAERLSAMGPVRVSDIAHLACLWSDSQRFHAALRGALSRTARAGAEGPAFLEAVAGVLGDHVLPVDLEGLPGDPGLLEGIPAMISRLGGKERRRGK
jgi:hypothetical protein